MLSSNETTFKQNLLKDYYKLTQMLQNNSDELSSIEIIDDIRKVAQILNYYSFFEVNNEYYESLVQKYQLGFMSATMNEYECLKNITNNLISNKEIYKKIHNSSKKIIKSINFSNDDHKRQDTNLSKKEFYDTLFSLQYPIDDYSKHILSQIKGKNLYVLGNRLFDSEYYSEGEYCGIKTLNKHYHVVEENIQYSYLTLLSSIHEMSHSYVDIKSESDTSYNLLRETFPFFNEFNTMELISNSNHKNNDVITNWKMLLINLKTCLNFSFDTIIDKNYGEAYFYVIGLELGFYLYEIYKVDPELCKNMINTFTENIAEVDSITLLKKLKIDIEEFTSGEVTKRLINKYNDTYMKFKS